MLCRKKFCQKNNCRDFLYTEGRLESMCAESRAFQLASWPIICRSKSSFCSGSVLRSLCYYSRHHPKSEVPTLNEQRDHIFKIHGRLVDCVHWCLPPCKKNAINILMQKSVLAGIPHVIMAGFWNKGSIQRSTKSTWYEVCQASCYGQFWKFASKKGSTEICTASSVLMVWLLAQFSLV